LTTSTVFEANVVSNNEKFAFEFFFSLCFVVMIGITIVAILYQRLNSKLTRAKGVKSVMLPMKAHREERRSIVI
jgi:hypothetical protein